MTSVASAAATRQTWWSVSRAHAAALVRAGGMRPLLLACALGAALAGLLARATLPARGDLSAPAATAFAATLLLAAGAGLHAGRWSEVGGFEGSLALVPDRLRLLLGQVCGTALVTGVTAVVCTSAVGVVTGAPTAPLAPVVAGLATAALTAQTVAVGVLCGRPVPTALALAGMWVVVPVLLGGVRVWLSGGARTAVGGLLDVGPTQLALAGVSGHGVGATLFGLVGATAWAATLGALAWVVLRDRDH